MHRVITWVTLIAFMLMLSACTSKKDGSIEGTIAPPAGVRAAAFQGGAAVTTADADPQTGRFRMTLPAGSYEVRITASSAPFPLVLPGVIVRPGETTILSPVSLGVPKGTGSVSGRVQSPGQNARVALFSDGVERASVATSRDGKYEFERLPAGQYTVRTSAPGYANDSSTVFIADERASAQDIRLLYITAIEGIDWNAGTIRARGIGLPPKQAPTPTVRREMAKHAALVDAERNMVRVLELINVAPGQTIGASLGSGNASQKLSGYLQGYRIAAERDMDGGKIEVEIELPLTGPGGLASALPR